jgi:hypothetical protein
VGHHAKSARFVADMQEQQARPRRLIAQLKALRPQLEPDARLLSLGDALPPGDWSLLLFTELAYANPDIWVDRAKMLGGIPSAEEMTLYDHVFADRDGELREVENQAAGMRVARAPIEVQFVPAQVRPGQSYEVRVPELAGETVDIAYDEIRTRTPHAGVGRKWCRLDANGKAMVETPVEIPAGRISIRRIRTQHGVWMPAAGGIDVIR